MAQARGSQTVTALYEETTYATNPATPAGQKLYIVSNDIQAQQNLINSNVLTASRERSRPLRGNINASGSLVMELGAESMGTILKHALGSNTTTGTDPYTHTMTLGDLPVGMIIEKDFGTDFGGTNQFQYFNGCRVASASFNFPVEGICTATFNIVGASETGSTTILDSDATLDDNGHTSFDVTSIGTIEEGGTAIATVESATIDVNNELDESVYVIGGSGQRRALPEGFSTVTGTLTALFETDTLLNKAIAGTESSLNLVLTRGDGLGSAGNESMQFTVNQLEYARTSPPITGPEGIKISLNYTAYLSGATSALTVIVKNAVATI